VARIAGKRGHDVTCLARGRSGPAPDGVCSDRWEPGALGEVIDHDWDAVVEVSWQPELVRSALASLGTRVRHWVYVSSVSVYADHGVVGADETGATHPPWAGSGEAAVEDYGLAKVACETAFGRAVPANRLLVARAGLIAGYGDRSDRFGYWPARIARVRPPEDSAVLVPPMTTPVQVIDVEDLADWLVTAAEMQISGTFDAVGDVVSFAELLRECAAATATDPVFGAPGQEWLLEHGVTPWAGPESLPLWLPVPEYAGLTAHLNAAAKRAHLSLRPLSETVQSSLAWERELGLTRERHAGLSATREAALLRELASRPPG